MVKKLFYMMLGSLLFTAVIGCASKLQSPEEMTKIETPPVSERLQEAALSLNSGDISNARSLYQEVIEELLAEQTLTEDEKKNNNDSKKEKGKTGDEAVLDEQRKRDYLSTAYTGLGVIDQGSGSLTSARESFEAALQVNPDNIAAREGIALVTLNEGNKAEAKKLLLEIQQKTTTAPRWRSINALGIIADLDGEYAQAITYYQQSISAGGPKDQALNNQGYSNLMAGKYQQALEIFTEAQNKYPDSVRINSNLALTLARLKKYDDARKTWARHLSEEEAWNNTGYVAMMNGDLKTARQYFEKAIELAPRYYPAAELNLENLKQLEGKQ